MQREQRTKPSGSKSAPKSSTTKKPVFGKALQQEIMLLMEYSTRYNLAALNDVDGIYEFTADIFNDLHEAKGLLRALGITYNMNRSHVDKLCSAIEVASAIFNGNVSPAMADYLGEKEKNKGN